MAIKDALLKEVLNLNSTQLSSNRYQRLREIGPVLNNHFQVDKPETNRRQTEDKLETEPETKNASSSSNNINTTTKEAVDNLLPSDWQAIDCEPLAVIGFTPYHLAQLMKKTPLTPQIVQDSIHAFAFDLAHNDKRSKLKSSALNYFMGVLTRTGPYSFPENYESPQDQALRLYLDRQAAVKQKREALEQQAFDYAFEAWLSTLAEAEKQRLLPAMFGKTESEAPKRAMWKHHFKENVWPKQQQQILTETLTST
jgi:hypothetical protein